MKKKIIIPVAVLLVLLVGAGAVIANMFSLFEKVPAPEIEQGEFDFTLIYSLDGEEKTIKGTYVCEFLGVVRAIDGFGRDWKGYIKGHDDIYGYDLKETDEGTIKIDLDFSPEFFMSDPYYKSNESSDVHQPEPQIYLEKETANADDTMSESDFGEYKGDDVKLISLTYDPPIENEYK